MTLEQGQGQINILTLLTTQIYNSAPYFNAI